MMMEEQVVIEERELDTMLGLCLTLNWGYLFLYR